MFFFTKNRPVLKDLIPNNHVDIHSHLLPGIDDGAPTFEHTLGLVKALQGFGFSQFVTTPHTMRYVWDNTKERILEVKNETVLELQKQTISFPFRAASEYMMDDHFVKLFQKGELLTLKDNYVLVEMSYINAPMQLYTILFDLQVAGYIPVLAHPERYTFYHNNFEEYLKLKRVGCLFQLNLLAVVGYYGESIAKIAEQLLQKGMYDFVGSDVHHNNHIAAFEEKVKIKEITAIKEVIKNNQFFRVE
ncbi:tyrosine-protein phosphatase [Flavobacterium taihuense]|uniref:protein-tyrosine-phosphatase n=1 Tax=Flavobacterium taihuense TaxID=2857508 RepID=A0ABS6XVZ5_9FLAO|nr:CpsB/CapC family capsule biosynthesis tyrosine phosphatase [Flavobacterium taihuense]MBW4360835.1 histidinol phosphatase [Flavobacterium taihuense]